MECMYQTQDIPCPSPVGNFINCLFGLHFTITSEVIRQWFLCVAVVL